MTLDTVQSLGWVPPRSHARGGNLAQPGGRRTSVLGGAGPGEGGADVRRAACPAHGLSGNSPTFPQVKNYFKFLRKLVRTPCSSYGDFLMVYPMRLQIRSSPYLILEEKWVNAVM